MSLTESIKNAFNVRSETSLLSSHLLLIFAASFLNKNNNKKVLLLSEGEKEILSDVYGYSVLAVESKIRIWLPRSHFML